MTERFQRGFTLIECLLALTIFSIIVTAVYAVFRSGVQAGKVCGEVLNRERRVGWFMDDLSREIENMVTQPPYYFEGDAQDVTFLSLLRSHDFHVSSLPRLVLVQYRVEKGVEGQATDLRKITFDVVSGEAETTSVQGFLRDLRFSYRKVDDGSSAWLDSWENEGGVPSSIRVEVATNDLEGEGAGTITGIFNVMSDRKIGPVTERYGRR